MEVPEEEKREVARVFHENGLTADETATRTEVLATRPQAWVDL